MIRGIVLTNSKGEKYFKNLLYSIKCQTFVPVTGILCWRDKRLGYVQQSRFALGVSLVSIIRNLVAGNERVTVNVCVVDNEAPVFLIIRVERQSDPRMIFSFALF